MPVCEFEFSDKDDLHFLSGEKHAIDLLDCLIGGLLSFEVDEAEALAHSLIVVCDLKSCPFLQTFIKACQRVLRNGLYKWKKRMPVGKSKDSGQPVD